MQVRVLLKIEIYGLQKRKYTYENFTRIHTKYQPYQPFSNNQTPKKNFKYSEKKIECKITIKGNPKKIR
jgi:hypothetical protein